MGRKLPFSSSPSPWPWPSCSQPKTHSFRATTSCLPAVDAVAEESSREDIIYSKSFSAASERLQEEPAADESEAVRRGLRSKRLFFDTCGGNTRSIATERRGLMEGHAAEEGFEGGVAMEMESMDPFGDFRASMEEMVEAHGATDWVWLQEMLVWFLKANGKGAHGFIVGAFLDMLIGLAASSSSFSSAPYNYDNPLCSSCSSSSSFIFEIKETKENSGNG